VVIAQPHPEAVVYPDQAYRPDPEVDAANAKRVREAEIASLQAERDTLLRRRADAIRKIDAALEAVEGDLRARGVTL
jgi:hypothetical protein